jgi:DNA-binding transcriptional ArsR family regulator
MAVMTPALLASVAERFKVLAEPARLRVLDALRHGPRHVTALVAATGLQQANLSRHLQQLYLHGFVARSRHGTFVHYAIADPQVFALCDLMCGQAETAQRLRRSVAPRAAELRAVAHRPASSRRASRGRGLAPR